MSTATAHSPPGALRFLEQTLGCRKVLLTTSCTHALEMAGLLLNFSEGDEVIVPSFTFVSTATALVRAGARLVFVDVRRDTLNLNEDSSRRRSRRGHGLSCSCITPAWAAR